MSRSVLHRLRAWRRLQAEATVTTVVDALVKPHDWPDVPDEDEYLTLPDEMPEEVLE